MHTACHIDRRFRTLAVNDPSLWQNLTVYVDTSVDEIQTWIARSHEQPIAVRLLFHTNLSTPSLFPSYPHLCANNTAVSTSAHRIIQALCQHFNQCRSLFIETACKQVMSIFMHALSTVQAAPIMESLILIDTNSCESPKHWVLHGKIETPFKGDLPLLNDVHLSGMTAFADIHPLSTISKDIHLHFELVDVLRINTGLGRINEMSENLTRLSLATFGMAIFFGGAGPIQLLRLRHLDISCWNGDELITTFETFNLPSLRVLGLNIGFGTSNVLWGQLRTGVGIVPRILRSVTTLILLNFPPKGNHVLDLVNNTPFLTTLVFRRRLSNESRLFRHLCRPYTVSNNAKPSIRCPKLANVLCGTAHKKNIMMLVTHRGLTGFPLKSIHILTDDHLEPHELLWLRIRVTLYIHPHLFAL